MLRSNKCITHGITGAVTLDGSTKYSISKNKELINFLTNQNFYESEEDSKTRERALGRLDFLLKHFIKQQMKIKGETKNINGRIQTFGSYRLGVHNKGADIDTLCIVPKQITRKEFFVDFYKMLEDDEDVSDLSKAEDAYVPVIKMKFFNIPIDLTMARINLPNIDNKVDLLNDRMLKNMNEKCILSLNGARVTDKMLELVPNTETFHNALRVIKFWAKKRYCYGNAYGYFGGVAYSISVARICQMYPNYCAYDIVCKYFEVYAQWEWPQPVILTEIVDPHYNLKVWDSEKNPSDRLHKMPIITPAYPSMCSTHNVSQSTFNVILREFQRCVDIIKEVNSFEDFKTIFENTDFFKRFKVFIKVTLNAEEPNLKTWLGYGESKIRILAGKIELAENVTLSVPFPKMFEKENTAVFFIGVEHVRVNKNNKKLYLDAQIKEFLTQINSWNNKTLDMKIKVEAQTKKEVNQFISDF
ncbi:hypothetical protein EHP00_2665 [Ecytonucleospora hepatopenaei]|uniref:Poly(A) polymerase n=1 Tax=Ecytonucleospora hepatopenaei TaxID=646526 RepID=A0A1W0E2P5_9MICR|nr:hypothetical protein EHP00_2665 [Ecytonucleospora hepatopenaei]